MSAFDPKMKRRFLSPQQLKIMELICAGKTMEEIGAIIHLAGSTVNNKVSKLKFEFECRTICQLVAKLIKNNMVLIDTERPNGTDLKKDSAEQQKQQKNYAIRIELLADLRRNINQLLKTYQEHVL